MSEGEFKERAVWVHPDEIRDHKVEEESREFVSLKDIGEAKKEFPLPYDAERIGNFSWEDKTYGESWNPKALAEWFLKWFGDIKK